MTIKQARNMDQHALTDSLSNALSSSTLQFASVIKSLAQSPNTKSRKSTKQIQEEIILVLQEIKQLKEMNDDGDMDEDLADAKRRLKSLQAERKAGSKPKETKKAVVMLDMDD